MKIEQVIQMEEVDKSIESQAIIHKGEAYTYFDSGLTRHVFVNADKTKVIKILVNKHSKEYNEEEVEIYKNASEEMKAQMALTGSAYDGFVVEQEFCNPMKFDNRKMTMPQMLFASSCRNEVGWTLDGRLVCFDLDEYMKW
jgi:hypothetical protein